MTDYTPSYTQANINYWAQALSKACSDAGVGDISQAYVDALGLPNPNAQTSQTKETPVTHTPSNLHNPSLPDYNASNPRIDMDEAELRSRLSSIEEVRTEVTAVAAGISFEDAWTLLQTPDGRDILNREIKRHYIRKEEQRDKERLDRLEEARAKFAETDENAAKRRRIEEARKRFEELGLGDGSYEER